MRHIPTRKILRISTFLAVSTGLALGSTAMAAAPADEAPAKIAQADEAEQQQDLEVMPEDDAEADEEVDYPSAIEDFEEFVEEHQQEGIDDVHEYTRDGAENMADAMREVLPQEDEWFEEEPEEYQALEDQLDAWEDRIDQLDDEERADYSELTADILNDGAEWLASVEETVAADQGDMVEPLNSAAEEIDPEVDIEQQSSNVENYYEQAVTVIKELYETQEEEPLAAAPTVETAPIAGSPQLAQQDDDNGFFDFNDDEVPSGVQDFDEFVEDHREDGIDHVADYTREGTQHYHDALEEFVTDDQELLQEQLDEMQTQVDELDDAPRAEFPNQLVNTLNEGHQVMMIIQQSAYPGAEYEEQVTETIEATEAIDTTQNIEAQTGTIENAFAQASTTLTTMAVADPVGAPGAHDEDVDVILAEDRGDYDGADEHDEPGIEEPGIEEPEIEDPAAEPEQEAELTEEIESYVNHVEMIDAEQLTGEEGEQNVVDTMNQLEEALATFVDEEDPMDDELEPAQYDESDEPGMEDEPGMQQEEMPGMEEEMEAEPGEEMTEHHENLREHLDELEQNIGEEEFAEHMKESVDASAELFAAIQTDLEEEGLEEEDGVEGVQYEEEEGLEEEGLEEEAGLEEAIENVQNAADEIDGETELDEQNEEVLAYFEATSEALEQMDQEQPEEEPEPVTLTSTW